MMDCNVRAHAERGKPEQRCSRRRSSHFQTFFLLHPSHLVCLRPYTEQTRRGPKTAHCENASSSVDSSSPDIRLPLSPLYPLPSVLPLLLPLPLPPFSDPDHFPPTSKGLPSFSVEPFGSFPPRLRVPGQPLLLRLMTLPLIPHSSRASISLCEKSGVLTPPPRHNSIQYHLTSPIFYLLVLPLPAVLTP